MKREIIFTALALLLLAASCGKDDETTTPPPPPEKFTTWDGSVATSYAAGTGTQSDPYQIETGAQLAFLHEQVISNSVTEASCFRLTANIDMAEILFCPIGSMQNDALQTIVFKGSFDGDGKRITGVKIDQTKSRFTALFSFLDATAVVKNLHVEGDVKNATLQPAPNKGLSTGGIAAANYGKIIDCTFSGNIIHTQPWGVGGVVGANYNLVMGCGYIGAEGKKIYCPDSANPPTTGVGIMGGVVGTNGAYGANAYVIGCYNTGAMESSADGRMGGVVGESFGDDPSLYHAVVVGCYNRGSMVARTGVGSGNVGGIVGYAAWGYTITACYNTATMSYPSDKEATGAIMGSCDTNSSALPSNTTTCYWLDTTHSKASSNTIVGIVKDCVSKTAAQLKSAELIVSLNEAIAEYNKSSFEKCDYRYVADSDGLPVLKKI